MRRKMDWITKMEKVRAVVRKICALSIFICLFLSVNGQHNYLLLPTEGGDFKVTSYKLHTGNLYKSDFDVETYNFIFPKTIEANEQVLLLSILPDFSTGELWQEITENWFDGKENVSAVIEREGVEINPYLARERMNQKSFRAFTVVKKVSGRYYVAKNCLLERFQIKPDKTLIPTYYGQLGLNEHRKNIRTFCEEYQAVYPQNIGYPLPFSRNGWEYNSIDGARIWKEFLSKKVLLNSESDVFEGYQFWTCATLHSYGYYDSSAGVGRFIYVPTKGIVASSYDFYFRNLPQAFRESLNNHLKPHHLSDEEWDQNVLNENLMLAEGFTLRQVK